MSQYSSANKSGLRGIGQNTETVPLAQFQMCRVSGALGFGRAMSNGGLGQWGRWQSCMGKVVVTVGGFVRKHEAGEGVEG